jgi:S1-C subfamily serine protease
MRIELRILSGARAGTVRSFDQATVRVGRAADSDLRFDAAADLDVSAHHAELRRSGSSYELVDVGSTNGTLVNGRAISGKQILKSGDVVRLGPDGPRVSAHIDQDTGGWQDDPRALSDGYTAERAAVAMHEQATWFWRLLIGAVALLIVVAGVGYLVHRHETLVSQVEMTRLVAANQEAEQAFQNRLQGTQDSALANEVHRRNETLAARARGSRVAGADGGAASAAAVATELARSNTMQRALADMDLTTVREQNDAAMVLIAAEIGGHAQQASGFSVSADGLIVTNRHVVQDSAGAATRIAVKFANTRVWKPAHVVRVDKDSTVDLALIQMNDAGPYPVVRGVSGGGVDVAVGAPIAALGFAPRDDSASSKLDNDGLARTSFSTGTVNRALIGLLQIDAFAGRGSSGSPVFDRHGHVIGVIWGGMSAEGRVVYAVPSDRLLPLLPAAVRSSIGVSAHDSGGGG